MTNERRRCLPKDDWEGGEGQLDLLGMVFVVQPYTYHFRRLNRRQKLQRCVSDCGYSVSDMANHRGESPGVRQQHLRRMQVPRKETS